MRPVEVGSDISIHAPLTGSDQRLDFIRMATRPISIHAPLTGSDVLKWGLGDMYLISIHAPLTGSDLA